MSRPRQAMDGSRDGADRLAEQMQRATTREEALNAAIASAEHAMKCLSLARDPTEKAAHRTRATQLMRDAERIKHESDWRAAVAAATLRHATSLPQNPSTPPSATTSLSPPPRPSAMAGDTILLKEPISTRTLTTREKIILARATFLNGVKFPLWESKPHASEFELKDGEECFFDESSELPLSDFQADVLDDWKRPSEALPPPSWLAGSDMSAQPTMNNARDLDLVQDAAADCSVVASLCAGSVRVTQGHSRLMRDWFFPWNTEADRPYMSPNGKYVVRLNFNGGFRKVVIDDRIPTSATNRVIHVVDRNNPGLVWPALVEKAYLKVRGGYDFPGSNSGTDIWILTGWIPEQVFLQSDDFDPDRFWQRITAAFPHGDVMITVGTGKISSKTSKALGLPGEHDYAILDLREVGGQHLMLIKNPWVDGTSWSGRRSSILEGDPSPVSSPRDLLNDDDKLKPGTFWMDMDNVMQNFESIYVNWNPGLFSHRQDIHFEWDLSDSYDESGCKAARGPFASLQRHRQFAVSAEKPGTIWVLLWRHFHNSVPETATAEEIESGKHFIDLNGHITIASFESQARRVLLAERHRQKGWFVDSPQTLLKMEGCAANTPYTLVPLEQELAATKHSFTISVFGQASLTLTEATPRYPHSVSLAGRWTEDTAGGHAQTPTYCANPQFALRITQPTALSILLETSDSRLNVNVKLLHGYSASSVDRISTTPGPVPAPRPSVVQSAASASRLHRVRQKDVIADSGLHRSTACLAEIQNPPLAPGNYIIICSTFYAGRSGPFQLRLESDRPLSTPRDFALLPRPDAGRVRVELTPAVFSRSDVVAVAAPLVIRRLVNLYVVVRPIAGTTTNGSRASHLRLSLYRGSRSGGATLLTVSHDGVYAACGSGSAAVRTEAVDLLPPTSAGAGNGSYWAVVERMPGASGVEERFAVEVFGDSIGAVDAGDWEEGWEE